MHVWKWPHQCEGIVAYLGQFNLFSSINGKIWPYQIKAYHRLDVLVSQIFSRPFSGPRRLIQFSWLPNTTCLRVKGMLSCGYCHCGCSNPTSSTPVGTTVESSHLSTTTGFRSMEFIGFYSTARSALRFFKTIRALEMDMKLNMLELVHASVNPIDNIL